MNDNKNSADDISALFAVPDELIAEYKELSAKLPDAEVAVRAALWNYENAQARFTAVCARVNTAIHHGEDATSPALGRIIESERRRRDEVGGKLRRARDDLSNLRWRLESLTADVEQLRRAGDPPRLGGPLYEVVKRPAPQIPDPVIQMPLRAERVA